MIKIEEIKTMNLHFFESPNKLLASDETYQNIIIAELENLSFEENFILDAKSFNMLKKIKTNRKITFSGNNITISSDEGKYKCKQIDKTKPDINIENTVYENDYNLEKIRRASRFTVTMSLYSRQQFCGVLFDDAGNVYGTDTFKIYKYSQNNGGVRFWSVPVAFIDLINKDDCRLKFADNFVIYAGDYIAYSRLYSGLIPDINRVIKDASNNQNKIVFKKDERINYYQSETIDMIIEDNNMMLVYKDEINEFKVNYPCSIDFPSKIELRFNYNHLNIVFNILGDDIAMNFSNDLYKPLYFKNGDEEIVLTSLGR